MYPTSDRLLQSVKSSLEEMIVPDLSSPYPIFTSRIIGTMCDYMTNRSMNETKVIIDSSEDIKSTLSLVMEKLGDNSALKAELVETKLQLSQIRQRDNYYSVESLINENYDLRNVIIGFSGVLHEKKDCISKESYMEVRKTLNGCTFRLLQREYELITPMVEFQKSIYNMG